MKNIVLTAIICIVFTAMFAQIAFDGNIHVPNKIIVCFDAEAIGTTTGEITVGKNENSQIQIGLASFDTVAEKYSFIDIQRLFVVQDTEWQDDNGAYPMNIFRVTLTNNKIIEQALVALTKSEGIIFAEYEGIPEMYFTPNDPRYNEQWHHTMIQSPRMWDVIQNASNIIVAIVDTGVKWNHADLWQNIYIDPVELQGVNIDWSTGDIIGDGIDYDGNGYPNDVMGWDFTNWDGGANLGDCNPYSAYGSSDHGTHVAGIVGAIGNNAIGLTGVAMRVNLLITRHSGYDLMNLYQGILYSASKRADIINCSWGSPASSEVANVVVNFATSAEALVVVAAGNSANQVMNYPAAAINSVAVGSTDETDHISYFSTYGTWVDLMAPGSAILSTSYNSAGDSYVTKSGTSMASPVVAGVSAIIKAIHPLYTPLQIKNILRSPNSCDPLVQGQNGQPYYGLLGGGRINAFKAIRASSLTHNLRQSTIHWVSFPYLGIHSKELGFVLHLTNNNDLLQAPNNYILGIAWNDGNNIEALQWDMMTNYWINTDHILDSRRGYKIQMSGLEDRPVITSGYLPSFFGAENEVLTLKGASRAAIGQTWVGYFPKHSEDPLYALQDVLPYLQGIKTQRWSMTKDRNGNWVMPLVAGQVSRVPRLNQGDAVILDYIYFGSNADDVQFTWQVRPELYARYEHPVTQHFSFEEQEDYIPIYISVADDMKNYFNAEIGLYINDVCYGAEVVHGDTIQINAYIMETEFDENAVVEFRYHEYSTRGVDQVITDYSVFDNDERIFRMKNLDFSQKEHYYQISFLGDDTPQDEITSFKTSLKGNYPNPFNPSTTISYSMAVSGNVKINVFNIRGQLVRTLVNDFRESGNYSIVWNGEDNNSNKVSSGIYFYRMETKSSTETKKMLLMK